MASELRLLREGLLSSAKDSEGGLRLDRFGSMLRRHVLLIASVTTLTAVAAVVKTVTDTPIYQAEFELSTPPVTLETQIISTINPDTLGNQAERQGAGLLDETKLKILTSPRVMEPVVEQLQRDYPTLTYSEVVGQMNIQPNATGEILTVQYQNYDAQKVSAVLDLVSQAYLDYSLKDRQNEVDRGIDFVDQQLPAVRARVNELEAEVERLRQSSNLIDPQMQGRQLSEQMAAFTAEQLDLGVQIEQTRKTYQDLQQELAQGEEIAATSVLLESDRYQTLLNQLLAIDSKLADDLTLYLDSTPEIEVIKEQRNNLKPLLEKEGLRVQEQVASYIRELEARDQALTDSIETLNGRIKSLSTVTRQYNAIQRDLEIAATNLNQFLTKREALRIDAAQRRTPWEMLTIPSKPAAAAADAKLNLAIGILLGILLGSGLAVLVDRMGNKVYTIDELKEATLVPVLGTIPYDRQLEAGQLNAIYAASQFNLTNSSMPNHHKMQDVEQDFSAATFLEEFKRLATNIRLNNPDTPIKTLTVSSATAGAGKSTVSYHLAQAYAALGQKTLLVDMDLRRPSLHRLCAVKNEKGLSNYVSNDYRVSDILVSLPTDENLFLIPSGPIPPDPAKILSAKKIETFLQWAYSEFDMVIFDTPPILGFADAFMVVKRTQGLLLTTRLGRVKFSQIQSALDELHTAKVPLLGLVANGSKQSSSVYDAYRKYYQTPIAEPIELIEPANHLN